MAGKSGLGRGYSRTPILYVDGATRVVADRLTSRTIWAPRGSPPAGVWFGAWVTLQDEEGAERTYQIVGPDEIDARGTLVSVESPLGRSLLGKRRGEEVTVRRPRGEVELVVVGIRYRQDPE